MSVWFKHNRLHVGYRLRDWSDVWYEPRSVDASANDNGSRNDRELFTDSKGMVEHEPLEGEVAWHPPFDPKNCEARSKPAIRVMHMQFLLDAHTYMSEKDVEEVRAFEEEKDAEYAGFARWQTWFSRAKAVKKKQMTAQKRRAKRQRLSREAGIPLKESDINSDSSDNSAYESEEGRVQRQRATGAMPPPPRPTKASGKRKQAYGERITSNPHSKRAKNSASASSARSSESRNIDDFSMSGGLGRRSASESVSEYDAQDHNEDRGSVDYIDEHPQLPRPTESNVGNPSYAQGAGSHSQPDDLRPFADWDRMSAPRSKSHLADYSHLHATVEDGEDEDEDNAERRLRLMEMNGDVIDEIEALERAVSQSMEPEEQRDAAAGRAAQLFQEVNGRAIDEEEAFKRAMRQSMQPEERRDAAGGGEQPPDGVRRSIEESEPGENSDKGGRSDGG